MSRKRGLSVEEKRARMMEFFYEKKDFFSLKELEKLCQKEKGITSMSVKEILTSLVDDGMVDTDKIGTSVYFWAFPSKASQNRRQKLDGLTRQLEELDRKAHSMKETIGRAQVGKEDSDTRSEVLASLARQQEEQAQLLSTLAQYRDSDPEVLKQMQRESGTCKEAADRWTDNIFSVKSWIKKKFSFDESVINKQFGIPEDLDYLE